MHLNRMTKDQRDEIAQINEQEARHDEATDDRDMIRVPYHRGQPTYDVRVIYLIPLSPAMS